MRLWTRQLTGGSSCKLNPIEARGLGTGAGLLKELRNLSMEQDVQVRAVNVIRSNVASGRTAALAVADGALHPTKADLSPKKQRAN